jgi:hypothetical protein
MPTDDAASTGSRVTSADIAALATRLADWSETLPPGERSLAQLLVQHARDLQPEDVQSKQRVNDISTAIRSVVSSINDRLGASGGGWVEIGPVWEKANKVELGEDVEIVQRLFARERR